MEKGNVCHRCSKRSRSLFQTDYVNSKIGRPIFPKGKLVCKKCVQKALGEQRYLRLMDDISGIAYR